MVIGKVVVDQPPITQIKRQLFGKRTTDASDHAPKHCERAVCMPLTLAYCWAHSRRKLHDIYQKDGSEIAAEGLRRAA